jgi:hypothetical protein
MFCTKCGSPNLEDAVVCKSCASPFAAPLNPVNRAGASTQAHNGNIGNAAAIGVTIGLGIWAFAWFIPTTGAAVLYLLFGRRWTTTTATASRAPTESLAADLKRPFAIVLVLLIVAVIGGLLIKTDRTGTAPSSPTSPVTPPTVSVPGRSSGLGAPPAAKGENWQVTRERSPMDGSTTVVLFLSADAPITIWLGEKTPELVVRCKESKTDAYVVTGTAAQPEIGSYGTVADFNLQRVARCPTRGRRCSWRTS